MDADYLSILRHEFSAEEGSFLIQLRCDLHWDKVAFDRLTEAMRQCCQAYQQEQRTEEQFIQAQATPLPRWLVSGFWYLSTFVEGHTSHQAWDKKRARELEYFRKAYQRLSALASWFFNGRSPWIDDEQGWASTFVE